MPDEPGQVATGRDSRYSLTIEDVATLYERAGHPRTLRTLQRYCASGHLDGLKVATVFGDKYFIDPLSVERHLAQIEELSRLDPRRDVSRPTATQDVAALPGDSSRHPATMPDVSPQVAAANPHVVASDLPRPVATAQAASPSVGSPPLPKTVSLPNDEPRPVAADQPAMSLAVAANEDDARYIARLEQDVTQTREELALLREQGRDEREFLREQIDRKDKTIEALIERDRETNFLIRGIQEMFRPMLGKQPPPQDSDERSV